VASSHSWLHAVSCLRRECPNGTPEQREIRPDPHFTKGINAIVRLESEYLVGNGCAVSLSYTAFALVTAGSKGIAKEANIGRYGRRGKQGWRSFVSSGLRVRASHLWRSPLDEEDDPECLDEPDKNYLGC
jgi:hypothetical protein